MDHFHDSAQALDIRQRKLKIFHQAGQFLRQGDRGRSNDDGLPLGTKSLGDIPQAPHHHCFFDMAVKVFQNEDALNGHGLQVSQDLGRLFSIDNAYVAGRNRFRAVDACHNISKQAL